MDELISGPLEIQGKLHEPVEIKIITFLTASPDEVARAITDEKLRIQWDLDVTKVVKKGQDSLRLEY